MTTVNVTRWTGAGSHHRLAPYWLGAREALVERRLVTILAGDVAGYSRLIGTDQGGKLAALKARRREIVDPAIAAHKGRIVKTISRAPSTP